MNVFSAPDVVNVLNHNIVSSLEPVTGRILSKPLGEAKNQKILKTSLADAVFIGTTAISSMPVRLSLLLEVSTVR